MEKQQIPSINHLIDLLEDPLSSRVTSITPVVVAYGQTEFEYPMEIFLAAMSLFFGAPQDKAFRECLIEACKEQLKCQSNLTPDQRFHRDANRILSEIENAGDFVELDRLKSEISRLRQGSWYFGDNFQQLANHVLGSWKSQYRYFAEAVSDDHETEIGD